VDRAARSCEGRVVTVWVAPRESARATSAAALQAGDIDHDGHRPTARCPRPEGRLGRASPTVHADALYPPALSTRHDLCRVGRDVGLFCGTPSGRHL
jgi:hypothetical protein